MAEVRPDEISAILRKQLSGFESEVDIYDVGTVLQVGDGIARVYGLTNVMASEFVSFLMMFLEWCLIWKKTVLVVYCLANRPW